MPKLNIDGQDLEVPAGENLLLAARRLGTEVPHFCWHEKLSIAANCRMCLVEIEKQPKLQPACQMVAADGMVVKTKSPKVLEARAAVMEFLLVNHPLDCPICDKAGECMLQDNYMAHDAHLSRVEETKVGKPRLTQLGPQVNYNAERCIMCTRCVRFMDEVAKNTQLGVFNRGDRNVIDVFPGKPLDDPYSMNVVELCPVGALGASDFRFNSRVWALDKTPSVCDGCAKGCNSETHAKKEEVYRLLPRRNDEVNSTWMCDEGRLSYHAHGEGRATSAMRDGTACTIDEALSAGREVLARAAGAKGQGWLLVVSPTLTNEDAFAWLSLAKTMLPEARIVVSGRHDGVGDKLLRRVDKNPNRRGLTTIATALGLTLREWKDARGTQVIVIGTEVPDTALDPLVRTAEHSLCIGAHATGLYRNAKIALPSGTVFEHAGSFTSEDGRVQRIRPAHPVKFGGMQPFLWAAELCRTVEPSLLQRWPNAESVFSELAERVGGFAGLRLLGLGLAGKLLDSGAKAKAAAPAAREPSRDPNREPNRDPGGVAP